MISPRIGFYNVCAMASYATRLADAAEDPAAARASPEVGAVIIWRAVSSDAVSDASASTPPASPARMLDMPEIACAPIWIGVVVGTVV